MIVLSSKGQYPGTEGITHWQLQRFSGTVEYKDVSKDQSGKNTIRYKRIHWVFERYRGICGLTALQRGNSSDSGDASPGDEYATSTLTFRPGGGSTFDITPPEAWDANGNSLDWALTSDTILPEPAKVDMFRQTQVWETYTGWVALAADPD